MEGCRRAIEMGVYPFVVPLRPVPGTLMADAPPPDARLRRARSTREVSAMLADAGLRPPGREGRLRALPGVLGAVGVGARVRARSAGVSSPTVVAVASAERRSCRLCRGARRAARRTSPCAARCSSTSRSCSRATTATSATPRPTTLHASAWSTARSSGAVRLYPLGDGGLWKGDRLAVLPERARTARSARGSCASPSRTAGERGGRADGRADPGAQRALLRAPRLAARRRRRRLPRRHAPADGDRRSARRRR